jgi:hypothetical protein
VDLARTASKILAVVDVFASIAQRVLNAHGGVATVGVGELDEENP